MIKVKIDDKGLQNLLKQLIYKTNTKTFCHSLNGILLDEVEENFAQPGRGNGKVLKKHRCSCSRRLVAAGP